MTRTNDSYKLFAILTFGASFLLAVLYSAFNDVSQPEVLVLVPDRPAATSPVATTPNNLTPVIPEPTAQPAEIMPTQTAPVQTTVPQPAGETPTTQVATPIGENLASESPRPATLPLKFHRGEKIAWVGNSLAERMSLFGNFETLLQTRFPELELSVRNFARPADEVAKQQRPNDYTKIDDPQAVFSAETYLCCFGFNESFAGPEGIEKFVEDFRQFMKSTAARYPANGQPPRFVLISPVAFEASAERFLPDGTRENINLAAYTEAIRRLAIADNLPFVDLFTPTLDAFSREPGLQFTINGCHLNERGDLVVAKVLDETLFGTREKFPAAEQYEAIRKGIVDKNWHHSQDYRQINGWYVYGGRRTWDTETFPQEYPKLRAMVAVRDREIWDLAQGKKSIYSPDDSTTGDLQTPQTRFGNPQQKYSEADELRILTPEEFLATATVPEGFEIQLFADERQFPELANPVQMNFDNRGRLWVSCMPTYPQWRPGEVKPNDRLLILEDTDGNGRADSCKVFYDQLHCPTGFEFWNGGVLVVDQPRLLFLKDTTGDDRADLVVHLMDGWATEDTHHTCSTFQWNNGGYLHMLEGIATSTTLETPWGPHRSFGDGGAYVLDPKSLRIRQFPLPGQYNMWCYSFDEWGQGFPGDGTTANQAWDTPLSGASFRGRQGVRFIFDSDGMRPALGSEFIVSRHFPDEVQGQMTFACVINMNGLPRFSLRDDGGGYAGGRIRNSEKQPDDLVRSTDKHFRPADPQIGPDGALWFGDWANPLIGHMQYSQRDPNRDKAHGRIYRLVYPSRPLLTPVTQADKSEFELLEQLRDHEWRTRYRARRELRDRPTAMVAAALARWQETLTASESDFDRLRCEVLWTQQAHRILDLNLLNDVALNAQTFQARAAAVRIVADEREMIPSALDLLTSASQDEHPRVRTEAARGLSFFPSLAAVQTTFRMLEKPADYWVDYTIYHTLGANQLLWRQAYVDNQLGELGSRAEGMIKELLGDFALNHRARTFITDAHNRDLTEEVRNKAMTALADIRGEANKGKDLFQRNCATCHKIGTEGRDFGPNLSDVGARLGRDKIVHSIVEPSAEVDDKYKTTLVMTLDGLVVSGLLVEESKDELQIYDGKELQKVLVDDIDERVTKNQSSMPDDLAKAMSPAEFVHLIEYLSQQQTKPTEENK
jgi:putative heme-binding domain-containing protein